MEIEMDHQEIVESYLEDYFGHDLFETLSTEEIAEAILVANQLANTVNEFFGINESEKKDESMPTLSLISPDEHAKALAIVRNHLELHGTMQPRKSGPPQERVR